MMSFPYYVVHQRRDAGDLHPTFSEIVVLVTIDWNLAVDKASQMHKHHLDVTLREVPTGRLWRPATAQTWALYEDGVCSTEPTFLIKWTPAERHQRLIEIAEEIMNAAVGIER